MELSNKIKVVIGFQVRTILPRVDRKVKTKSDKSGREVPRLVLIEKRYIKEYTESIITEDETYRKLKDSYPIRSTTILLFVRVVKSSNIVFSK